METLNYVQRKSDGFYFSVDGDFIPPTYKNKAFVFHEGAAMSIGDFLTDEYEIIPLTTDEAGRFECAADTSFCSEHGTYFVECGHLGHGDDYDPDETL